MVRSKLPILLLTIVIAKWAAFAQTTYGQHVAPGLPSLDEVVSARRDLWGEAAMAEPNGPSYEFFRDLLPPPRYVHADFRYYPLVLSAPRSPLKARLISNGSGVNLRGGSRSWKDVGTPVTIRVGPDEFRFGELQDRVSLPTLAGGYLPIYTIDYRHPYPVQSEGAVPLQQQAISRPDEVYRLEAFADVSTELAESGVVWVRFSLAAGSQGIVSLDVDASDLKFAGRELQLPDGTTLVFADSNWKWSRGLLSAKITADRPAVAAIATRPIPSTIPLVCNILEYESRRTAAAQCWFDLLSDGMSIEVPEPLVQNAWRHLILQNLSLIHGDRIFYSASNQYEQLYEAEGSDAALAMLMWGRDGLAKELMPPLLDFKRAGLESHIASLKVQDIVQYFRWTRDRDSVLSWRSKWQPELERLMTARDASTGLLPKERYCGDISTPVSSLSVDAKAWRAMFDMATVFQEIGEKESALQCSQTAAEFKETLDDAVLKSVRRDITPPFVPIALLDKEPIHDPITEVRIGSYWNIIMPYVIGSRIFAPGSPEELWIPHYVEQHGGLCMGMTRSGGTSHGFWTGPHRVNPLYGNRYVADVLRRDDADRALTSFYGMLAQGFTRNTFVVGEGSTLAPVDGGGRFFYCPPNTAGNGHFLTMLRNLLVQDWDLDDDGRPETLRLAAAVPRLWLADGKRIVVDSAPTSFGQVNYAITSRINSGVVEAEVEVKQANDPNRIFPMPEKIQLRCRLLEGYEVVGVTINGEETTCGPKSTVELPRSRDRLRVVFSVKTVAADR